MLRKLKSQVDLAHSSMLPSCLESKKIKNQQFQLNILVRKFHSFFTNEDTSLADLSH